MPERSLGFARDDDTGIAFSKHIHCTLREINPFPPTVISSAVEKSSLHSALSCFLRKRFPLFRCLTYGAIPVCKKDPSASLGMTIQEALSKHIRCTLREINPFPAYCHFERSEKSPLNSALSCFLRRSILVFRYHTYDIIPSCNKDPSTALGITIREWRFPNIIRCTLREINPSPHTVISSAARNLPCTPRFLASFAEAFPFSAVSHTALYQCARKIPRLRSG